MISECLFLYHIGKENESNEAEGRHRMGSLAAEIGFPLYLKIVVDGKRYFHLRLRTFKRRDDKRAIFIVEIRRKPINEIDIRIA